MWQYKLLLVLGCLHASVVGQWSCTQDSDCSDIQDGVCHSGVCGCPSGQQVALGGTACVDLAPYHTSECLEDHQCSRLFTMFECRPQNGTLPGRCACQEGFHYFHGRCWRTVGFGEGCARDEECIGVPRDPYSMQCGASTCTCAEGYYERQRGECRRIGHAVGEGCVLDEDCQFPNGVCQVPELQCVDSTATKTTNGMETPDYSSVPVSLSDVNETAHGSACSALLPCPAPLQCSTFGACVCPIGYYVSDNSTVQCNAELGSASNAAQCVGLLAQVFDGVCRCPNNFFYEENMRDCVRVTRRISESCVADENCHTFGAAAVCSAPRPPWDVRECECDTARSVWDSTRNMCRLFAGIGEHCEVDSDCLAGELEIQCVASQCACPVGLVPAEGLCLTTGLALGDSCQATAECTETANTACINGNCSCAAGYQDVGGFCAPIIGGSCEQDSDCVIEDTWCVNATDTCQCRDGYVAYDDVCWTVSSGYESICNVTEQCTASLGSNGVCRDGSCGCENSYHHRDGQCWPVTDLFEACSRTSECYLPSMSERVVCRNSMCQCDFEHPYSEELHTCLSRSSAVTRAASSAVLASALTLTYMFMFT